MSSIMAMGMTQMIREKHPPTEANCVRFETVLRDRLVELLSSDNPDARHYRDHNGWDDGGVDIVLSVDYHPCATLDAALEAAGIHESIRSMAALPLKTITRTSARRLMIKHGYGARWTDAERLWGCSREEIDAYAAARDVHVNRVWEALHEMDMRGTSAEDWQGPIKPATPSEREGGGGK